MFEVSVADDGVEVVGGREECNAFDIVCVGDTHRGGTPCFVL